MRILCGRCGEIDLSRSRVGAHPWCDACRREYRLARIAEAAAEIAREHRGSVEIVRAMGGQRWPRKVRVVA
jgi:hypothetical protein